MLGAYAKVMGQIRLETINEVITEAFGEKVGAKNFAAAQEAYKQVKRVK